MRAVVGFIFLNAWLIAVGLGPLRALKLWPREPGLSSLTAIGPAFLLGITTTIPLLCVGLVAGIPLSAVTLAAAGLLVLLASALITRHRTEERLARVRSSGLQAWLRGAGYTAAAVYMLYGAVAFSEAPSRGDDARIWSLRGLTLSYFHRLQPEIFLNPFQAGAHPVYPLLQPVLEALMSIAMGAPQLRLYHTELWLLVMSGIWSAAYLIGRRVVTARPLAFTWAAPLCLLVLTYMFIDNVYVGDADVNGSLLLALGVLGLGFWLSDGDGESLGFGAVLLAASATTKDEDFLVGVLVLLCAGLARAAVRRGNGRASPGPTGIGWRRIRPLAPWLAAGAYVGVIIAPWRIWLAVHHLRDSVQPPLPRALSPAYIVDKHHVHLVLHSMLYQTLEQWGWSAAIFLVTCLLCVITGTARRVAGFYFIVWAVAILALLWLYSTTSLSLAFLLPTSMDRTVGVFMIMALLATAHLLARMTAPARQLDGPSRDRRAPPLTTAVD